MQKLLLADDHELVRETIADFLRLQGGFEVVTGQSFDEALAVVRAKGPFELVMLDYSMPGMDALSGLARMRSQCNCPVAILSGTATPDVARRALSSGASGFSAQDSGAAIAGERGAAHVVRRGLYAA